MMTRGLTKLLVRQFKSCSGVMPASKETEDTQSVVEKRRCLYENDFVFLNYYNKHD